MTFTYKKFTLYVMIFTVTLFAVYSYIIVNHKMLFMNIEYPGWTDVQQRISPSNTSDYNFIAFGDSRLKSSFLPKLFDDENINSVNFALGGSTPIEGYYTFQKYLNSHRKPEYLLLGYSPALLTSPYFYKANTVKFGFLKDDEYEEVARLAKELNDDDIIGSINYRDYKLYTGKYLTDLINGMFEYRWRKNKIAYQYLQTSKGQNYAAIGNQSTDLSSETKLEKFVPSKLINAYLERILTEAKRLNIKVFWYSNPINNLSYQKMSKDIKVDYRNYLETLSAKYGLIILNELYSMDANNFGDADHVYLGAPEVTQNIKKEFLSEINND